MEAGVMLIQTSMPSAVLTYLIAEMYSSKKISDNIASTVVVSTFMSFITVPIVVFLALKYFYLEKLKKIKTQKTSQMKVEYNYYELKN